MSKKSQVIPLRTQEIIENEAADWLAKLDSGNLSAGDRGSLREWLAQSPEHASALKELAAIWNDLDYLLNDQVQAYTPSVSTMIPRLLAIRPVFLGAMMLMFCAIGFLIWNVNSPVTSQASLHVTAVGIQHVEHFSDGSTAYLNTDSIIETEYSENLRVVRLLRGEAMFDVAHDPDRPFVVYAGNRAVKAVGTKFVVRLDSENILVTVTDGQVQLSKRTKEVDNDDTGPAQQDVTLEQEIILVSKGEEVEINEEHKIPKLKEIKSDELQRRLSWLDGQLIFKNERLELVIKEISRYVPGRIIIDDPELRDIRISGRFAIGDTEALLEAIEVSFNVQASHSLSDQTIRLSR